jgi:hypothetical protein
MQYCLRGEIFRESTKERDRNKALAVPPLDLRDLPNWELASAALPSRMVAALPDAGLLLFLNLVLFLSAHVVLLRTDVRPL